MVGVVNPNNLNDTGAIKDNNPNPTPAYPTIDQNELEKGKQELEADKKDDKKKAKDNAKKEAEKNDVNNVGQIAFGYRMSAEIIRDIIKTFIMHTDKSRGTNKRIRANDNKVKASQDDLSNNEDENTQSLGAVGNILYEWNLTGMASHENMNDILTVDIPDDATNYILNGNNITASGKSPNGENYSTAPAFGKVFNTDEAMQPAPQQFLAYNGSILSMINELSNKPFNELFFTHEEGGATLHYRQTPFEEEDWFALPYVQIDTKDVVGSTFDFAGDAQQYSIFKLTSALAQQNAANNQLILPITDNAEELLGRYGYKTMEVATQYFDNPKPENDTSSYDDDKLTLKDRKAISNEDSTDDRTSAKTYPSLQTVLSYPEVTENMSDAKKREVVSSYTIDNYYGGEELANSASRIAQNKSLSAQERVNMIMDESVRVTKLYNGYNPMTQSKAIQMVRQGDNGNLDRYFYIMNILPEWERPFPDSNSGMGGLTGYLHTASGRKSHPNEAARDIWTLSKHTIGSAQARAIIDVWNTKGTLTLADYNHIMSTISHSAVNNQVLTTNKVKGKKDGEDQADINQLYVKYQKKLFNYYADNSKYVSGQIQIYGRSNIEFGQRLYYKDNRHPDQLWEFYIESVEHSFDLQSGWITTIGVTRGLLVNSIGDSKRFNMFWGKSEEFRGGFFGEDSIIDSLSKANANRESSGGDSGDDDSGDGKGIGPSKKGSKAAMAALKLANSMVEKDDEDTSIYSQNYHATDFIKAGKPWKSDCSGFVYYIYLHSGFTWGEPVLTTWGIAASPKVETVGKNGSNKRDVWDKLQKGDIVFWFGDEHVGIYAGGGKCIACNGNNAAWDDSKTAGFKKFNAGPNSGYWWDGFGGHVVRVK